MKVCLIYNSAQHYRESIFLRIDEEFDCDYLFGKQLVDIKQMDTSKLRGNVTLVCNHYYPHGFYWQPKVISKLRGKYEAYLMLGETRCLSTWLFCLLSRIFTPKKRIYFWSHGWYGKESKFEKLLKKVFFRLPNGGIFLYGNYARELMLKEGFNPNKLFVIHNSLAYDQQLDIRNSIDNKSVLSNHFGNDYHNLLFVGRLTKVKHLDLILYAMSMLRDKNEYFNLTLIGNGDTMEELKELSLKLGIEKNIWFYGACYDESLLGQLIYNADLCVSPGNVGLTAMHSMVFGTPVVTHDDFTLQMPEFEAIHDGETGTFFRQGSVESLAENIQKWFAKKGKQREVVRQACFKEIDTQWTPQFQITVLKRHLK